jgi:hypothetical protein
MSSKTSVRTSYRASVLAAENAQLCAEQPPAADALQPTLRSGFQARLRRSVRLLPYTRLAEHIENDLSL